MGRAVRQRPACLPALLAACVALAGCAGGAPGAHPGASPLSAQERARIEREIGDLEARFNGSYQSNDMDTYWSFYADDLMQLWDSGRVSLEQYRKDWTAMLQAGGAVLEARMDDLQVRVSPAGDAAVASYRIFVRMRDAAGKESSAWYHESDTWYRRDGRWQVVHLHYSAVPPAAGP